MPHDFEELIRQAHADANSIRRAQGLKPWDFGDKPMADERCKMCHDAGFPNVIAHYKGIEKGRSHDGKEHPPLCWDHKHGKTPRHILEANGNSTIVGSSPIEESVSPAAEERCGCGRPVVHRGRCAARREKPANQIQQAITKSAPVSVQAKRQPREQMSLVQVLENLQGMLEEHQKETVANVDAVRRVIMLVQGAEKAGSAAEFFGNG